MLDNKWYYENKMIITRSFALLYYINIYYGAIFKLLSENDFHTPIFNNNNNK